MPLIVLSAGRADSGEPTAAAETAHGHATHATVAALSRRGRHFIVAQSGHHIQIEQPQQVIEAVREAVEGATAGTARSP